MKDLKKIQEFFSKSLEETTFKKGDKVTYLGHPGEITGINKEMTGAITYNVAYDKGNGRTKVSNLSNKGGEIKPIKEGNHNAEDFKPYVVKDSNNPNFLKVFIQYPTGTGFTTALGQRTMTGQDRDYGADKAMKIGQVVAAKLDSKYNLEDIDVSDNGAGKVIVFAVSDDFIKINTPSIDEAEEKYTVAGRPVTLNKGKKTDGTDWTVTFENGKSKSLADVLALIKPMPKGITMNEAKEETGVDMAKKQLDALGVKYEMSKTDKVRPFKVIYKPINKSDEFYDKFEDIVDLFNLKGFVKSSMNENFPGPGEVVDAKYLNNAMLDYFNRMNIKLLINTKTEKGIKGGVGTMYGDLVFNGDDIKLKDIVSVEIIESSISEAKKEDAIDTITMDVPLFIRILEYSREDAKKDVDLHDVTDKAISLGKERGILSMEDYEEIVGAAEKVDEANVTWSTLHRDNSNEKLLKQSKLSSSEYQKAKKLQGFKADNYKWNTDEDLYVKVVEEGMGGQLDEPFFIEVSVRDARKALDLFQDRYRNSNIDMYGSNVYAADTPEDIYDLYYDLMSQDIEVLDYNVEDEDFDYDSEYEDTLMEANVPSNIAEFAKRKGVSSLVRKVAGWAEKVGARIAGGTAVGKNYSTLVLDLDYKQQGEIRINTDEETIELYDEPVRNFNEFQRVYIDGQDNNLEEGKEESLSLAEKIVNKIKEDRPGLWANIHAQRERGEKPARKGSKDYKSAVAAGKRINKEK